MIFQHYYDIPTPISMIFQHYYDIPTPIAMIFQHYYDFFIIIYYIMPFINSYNGAMQVLTSISTGTCTAKCKTQNMRKIRYSLKTKTNPLGLTKRQYNNMTEKLKSVSGSRTNVRNNHSKTLKKYKTRKSPPYPANRNCNKTMKGNDGNMYISTPNIKNICTWKKITQN
jgi:hypothetical protein